MLAGLSVGNLLVLTNQIDAIFQNEIDSQKVRSIIIGKGLQTTRDAPWVVAVRFGIANQDITPRLQLESLHAL